MFKKLLVLAAMLWAGAVFAADANKASAAELDAIKGVGPSLSGKIMEARKKGDFKDWNDFMARVSGVKEARASKLSAEGLTVNGKTFDGAAKPAEKSSDKGAEKAAKPTKG